jgi:hypothetical protein
MSKTKEKEVLLCIIVILVAHRLLTENATFVNNTAVQHV